MEVTEKIRETIWCSAIAAAWVWVFGYIDGWGWVLQLLSIGFGSVAIWEIWTDQIPDPTLDPSVEDEE